MTLTLFETKERVTGVNERIAECSALFDGSSSRGRVAMTTLRRKLEILCDIRHCANSL
jgi:hypothetical protein